jgi:putative ABC transport system permease protein
MDTLTQDLRYALRALRASPGFTLVAVLALGLGIGANTAMFSVVNAVLVQPLPFMDPARLVVLYESNPERSVRQELAAANVDDWRRDVQSLDGIVTWISWGLTYGGDGTEPEDLVTVRASANLFTVLGVAPRLGRGFVAEDDDPGRARVVVVSDGFWRGRLGSDPHAVGRSLVLDDAPYEVIGVMPPGFRFPDDDDVDLWTPLVYYPFEMRSRAQRMFNGLARLAPGATLERAQAELTTVAERLAAEFANTNRGWTATAVLATDVVTGSSREPLLILFGAVGCVLLIACANVGNLLLVRGAGRQRELAVRTALGAQRGRLVRLLLTESLLLALAGAAVGVLLAVWSIDLLLALEPGHLPGWNPVRVDGTVLGFTAGLAVLVTVAAGLAPAFHSAAPDLHVSLKEGSRATAGAAPRRLRQALVISQVALSLILVAGAGLLIRSLYRLDQVQPGFDPERLLAVTIYLPDHRYPDNARQGQFFAHLLERVRAIPGVVSAGAVTTLPFSQRGIDHDMPVAVAGKVPPLGEEPEADFRIASDGYFDAMRIPIVAGREFTARDRDGAPPVVMVNQAFVRHFFPGENPLEQRVRWGRTRPFSEVIGVVGPVHHRGLDAEPRPEIYVPYQQMQYGSMTLAVRTAGEPLAVAGPVKQAVYAIDPAQPITDITTMSELFRGAAAERWFNTLLLCTFAALALGLAAIGLYGVLSYSVAQRVPEIGVRMALGAGRSDVFRTIVGDGLRLAAIGVAAGAIGALVLTRLLRNLVFQVSPSDPAVLAAAALLLLGVAASAALLPARRATQVDPMVALRTE